MTECLRRKAFSLYYFHVIYFINLTCCLDSVTDGLINISVFGNSNQILTNANRTVTRELNSIAWKV